MVRFSRASNRNTGRSATLLSACVAAIPRLVLFLLPMLTMGAWVAYLYLQHREMLQGQLLPATGDGLPRGPGLAKVPAVARADPSESNETKASVGAGDQRQAGAGAVRGAGPSDAKEKKASVGAGDRRQAGAGIIRADLSFVLGKNVWDSILASLSPKKSIVVEVGSQNRCVTAADMGYVPGYTLFCFLRDPPHELYRIHPHKLVDYGVAGEYDTWKMEKKSGPAQKVADKSLDDFIANDVAEGAVDLLAVDTDGFEPLIFSGLARSIKSASVSYILLNFHPRAMDLVADTAGQCSGHKVLDELATAGYELYATKVDSHFHSPLNKSLRGQNERQRELYASRPFGGGSEAFCRWYFELEKKYPSQAGEKEYKRGYWSDILAVAPGKTLPDTFKIHYHAWGVLERSNPYIHL